jgi:hypothetical protein
MNILFGTTLAVGLATALMLSARQEIATVASPATAAAVTPAAADREARLTISGSGKACVIVRTAPTESLAPDPTCDTVMPGLSNARFWHDNGDGSVAINDAEGRTLAQFAEADGAGYESFEPRLPLMSLIAEN